MISLMIVAGVNSKPLATFLEQRGTFTADFVYNDLHSNAESLYNQIIKVDKLVYVYRLDAKTGDADTNVRADMQTLRSLLQSSGFFQPQEILFLCGAGNQYAQAKRYFTTVMEECGVKNSAVRTIDKSASFASVYDNLIGVTLTKDFKNTYRSLYRKERGSTSVVGYNASDDRDLIIEPFGYDNLKNWDDQKKLAASIEQQTPIADPDDTNIDKWHNPDFAGIKSSDILTNGNLTIVTGPKRSGKSVWAAALASSALNVNKKVAVYDFTDAQDLAELTERQCIALQKISPLDMMRLQKGTADVICSLRNDRILVDFVCQIVKQRFRIFDAVIVVLELDDFAECYDIMANLVSAVLYTAFPRQQDAVDASNTLKRVSCTKIVALAKVEATMQDETILTAEDVKQQVHANHVIKQSVFKRCDQWPLIYPTLVLGGNKDV